MKNISRKEAQKKINSFFLKEKFSKEEMRKIKRLSMKHRLKLKEYKKLYCKYCLSQLKGKTRITATHKTIVCSSCKKSNRFKIA